MFRFFYGILPNHHKGISQGIHNHLKQDHHRLSNQHRKKKNYLQRDRLVGGSLKTRSTGFHFTVLNLELREGPSRGSINDHKNKKNNRQKENRPSLHVGRHYRRGVKTIVFSNNGMTGVEGVSLNSEVPLLFIEKQLFSNPYGDS